MQNPSRRTFFTARSLDALAQYWPSELDEGTQVWVSSEQTFYSLVKTAPLPTPNGTTIIASLNQNSVFVRFNGSTAPSETIFYNVRDYGAKGDGVTDDQPAIQKAIAAAAAAGGGVVWFPAGTYAIAAGLSVPGGIILQGAGRFVTWLAPKVSMAAISYVYLALAPEVNEIGIRFDSIAGTALQNIGIDASNVTAGRFNNVVVRSSGHTQLTGFMLQEDTIGSAPYYNIFQGCDVAGGGSGFTSYGYYLRKAPAGNNTGANANTVIGGHVTLVDAAVWVESGTMNVFKDIVSESIVSWHYLFGALAQQNHVQTGYYEGFNTAYLTKFISGEAGNIVIGPDNGTSLHAGGPTISGIIDPASVLGVGSGTQINNSVYNHTIAFASNANVGFGSTVSATLSTTNYNAQLVEAQASFNISAGLLVSVSGQKMKINTTGIGFYTSAPVAQQTVTGAKGGNVALGNLITALATLGLIIDGTS